jgi:hypothetical protein
MSLAFWPVKNVFTPSDASTPLLSWLKLSSTAGPSADTLNRPPVTDAFTPSTPSSDARRSFSVVPGRRRRGRPAPACWSPGRSPSPFTWTTKLPFVGGWASPAFGSFRATVASSTTLVPVTEANPSSPWPAAWTLFSSWISEPAISSRSLAAASTAARDASSPPIWPLLTATVPRFALNRTSATGSAAVPVCTSVSPRVSVPITSGSDPTYTFTAPFGCSTVFTSSRVASSLTAAPRWSPEVVRHAVPGLGDGDRPVQVRDPLRERVGLLDQGRHPRAIVVCSSARLPRASASQPATD